MLGNVNLWAIFTTGLLTGGLSCLAVQGGLMATILADEESGFIKVKADKNDNLLKRLTKLGHILPVLSFLISKLIAYTILGFLLGLAGEALQLSLQVRVGIQVLVAVFMFGTALNMLEAHPIFRYFAIQPPRFLAKMVRRQARQPAFARTTAGRDFFAPGLLGAFTIFIPCGVTQAMMALAIGTASPIAGAVVMFVFILGTSPIFFILGYLTMKLGDVLRVRFTKVAALLIIVLAVVTLNSAIALTGSLWTLENIWQKAYCVVSYCLTDLTGAGGGGVLSPVSEETIIFKEDGYSPNTFAVKAGSLVTLHLKNEGGGGCVQAFTIPALNIQKVVPIAGSETITFNAPEKAGKISFMCSMGMYGGVMEVI